MKRSRITHTRPFKSYKNTIWNKITAFLSYYWVIFRVVAARVLRIIGQLITLPFYLIYGLFWTLMLLGKMIFTIIGLSFCRASLPQWQLEIGRVFLIHGADLQVGQPVRFKNQRSKKIYNRWVANLHYDFKNNKVNTTYSTHEVTGYSERFNK